MTAADEDWPGSPRPPGSPQPDPLPMGTLPGTLRGHVFSVAENLQVPPDLPFLLSFGVISAAVAGKVRVVVRSGWEEPVGVYAAVIQPPGSRKSPAFAVMTAPLREGEAEAMKLAEPRVLAARDAADVAANRLETVKKDAARGKAKQEEVEAARIAYQEAVSRIPRDGRLLAGDITPEAIVARMAIQRGRMAILEPEPGPLQLLAGRYSDVPRLDELKKSWSEEAIIVDRKTSPPLRVPRPSLTMIICLQPGVLNALQDNGAFRREGALARFLWSQPPHGLGSRLTGEDVPPLDEEAAKEYARIVRTLLEVCVLEDGEDGSPRYHLLRLDPEALDVLHRFEAEVEVDLADGGRFEGIRDWAGKMVGQAVRVAALLELAARAGDGRPLLSDPIGHWAVTGGVEIIRALASHALFVFSEIGMDEKRRTLRYVLEKTIDLVQNPPPEEAGGASLRNLYERVKGRDGTRTMDDLNPLVEELVQRDCVRLIEVDRPGPGRNPSPHLGVHPDLLKAARTIPRNEASVVRDQDSANTANLNPPEHPEPDRLALAPKTGPFREVPDLFSDGGEYV